MAEIEFTIAPTDNPTPDAERKEILADPAFGQQFTDHMVSIDWTEGEGWHNAQVRAYQPVTLDPASNVFHYGQAIFEGLKAYRHTDGSITAFRPEQNAQRLNHSARRLAMPELPEETFLEAVRQIVEIDKDWVPEAGGEASLYLRPFMFASEAFLGVRPAQHVTFMVIASPAGAYFKGGIKPVSIWLSRDYARAGRGGTGWVILDFEGEPLRSLAERSEPDLAPRDVVARAITAMGRHRHPYVTRLLVPLPASVPPGHRPRRGREQGFFEIDDRITLRTACRMVRTLCRPDGGPDADPAA